MLKITCYPCDGFDSPLERDPHRFLEGTLIAAWYAGTKENAPDVTICADADALPADLDPIYAIAERHNLAIVEDAAHAIPTRYNGRLIGSAPISPGTGKPYDVHWSVCFSFYATKAVTTGEGGMITTNDAELAEHFGRQLEAGTVFQNRCDYLDPVLAWKKIKNSGKGCTLSPLGFDQFVRQKSYHLKTP